MNLPMRATGWAVMGSPPCDQPGMPAWVDFGTTAGTSAAARFYCSLFGWRVVARHRPLDDAVGYWVFREDDREVAGLGPAREAAWTVYVHVTDVDATARAVEENGGTVLSAPTTIEGAGRTAFCQDPEGATFALWEPDPTQGAGRPGPPHAQPTPVCHYQVVCRDVEGATRFYGAVFGWTPRATRTDGSSAYVELVHPFTGQSVAGLVEIDDRRHHDVPAHWTVPFAVTDLDRTAEQATALGAEVSVGSFELPKVGRLAVLNDPERALFSVLQAA